MFRVKAEAAISVNGSLAPVLGIWSRVQSFSPGCCKRDTDIPRPKPAPERMGTGPDPSPESGPGKPQRRLAGVDSTAARLALFRHARMLYVKKNSLLRRWSNDSTPTDGMGFGVEWTDQPPRRMPNALNKSLGGI